jgi:phosphatidylcholine synthase
MNEPAAFSPARRAAAWGVHFYTATGLPLAMLACVALAQQDASLFFLTLTIAAIVDATDGTLARKVGVREVVPDFDGRKLDDIVDFLNFAFLPGLALMAFPLLPEGWSWAAALPVLASGYGFCQERAKTDDAFVGFPSYWNIHVLYLYVLDTDPWAGLASTLLFTVLVFVPIHYLYPSKTKLLKPLTVGLGILWTLMVLALCLQPEAAWARPLALVSLFYPVYYMVLSLVHHQRVHAAVA